MLFSSILFLCLFLSLTVMLYYLLPRRFRNLLLLVSSLIFYAWGEPKYILIMLFSTVFDYANGRLISRFRNNSTAKKVVLVNSLIVNLGLLCYFKYSDFALVNINKLIGTDFGLLSLALPIGISFYTFQTLSYTIDVYRGKVEAERNIVDFGMYICMFPQLIAGPIVRYTDIEKQLRNRRETAELMFGGLVRFAIGLGKKVLLANQIGGLWDEIASTGGAVPVGTAWIGALAFGFQIYFDFSGYSDMAIGLGQIFGFQIPENFRYPYESASITEFWRRWHITLSTWFREYLYIPLGGNRRGKSRQIFNLLVVWGLTGLWHGAGWNFVAWGLFYFVLLVLEKIFLLENLKKWPRALRHIYTLSFVLFGWIVFACDDLSLLKSFMRSIFGSNGLMNNMTLYYLQSYGLLFIVLAIGSTSIPAKAVKKLAAKLRVGDKRSFFVEFGFVALLLFFSFVLLIGESYNPFLYFRF